MTENDLDKITVDGNITLAEYLQKEEQKETKSVYFDEVKEKYYKTPIHTKVKYLPKKERNGKVMNVTQEHKNKYVTKNFDKCKNFRQVVVAVLLSGRRMTSAGMLDFIKDSIKDNPNLRKIFHFNSSVSSTHLGLKISISKVYNTMHILGKTELGKYMVKTPHRKNDKGKPVMVYSLNEDGLNLKFEDAVKLIVEKGTYKPKRKKDIPKSKIKKAVKDHKKYVFKTENTIHEIAQRVVEQVDYKYKNVVESLAKELQETKEMLNKLMLNTPSQDLAKTLGIDIPKTIKIDIPTNFYFHFGFSVVDDKGERK